MKIPKEIIDFGLYKIKSYVEGLALLSDAKSIDDSDLEEGDLVNINNKLSIVVRKKTENEKGLLAGVDLSYDRWHCENSYCGYAGGVGFDGRCGLETKATSRTDGELNQKVIKKLQAELAEKYKPEKWGCPPNEFYFDAFVTCRTYGDGWYLPAINELEAFLGNKTVTTKWFETVLKTQNIDCPKNEELIFWSSTDNGNKTKEYLYGTETIEYSEALAAACKPGYEIHKISYRKSNHAYTVPFHKY